MELSGRACAQTASAEHSRLQKPTNITDIVQDTLMLQFGVGMSSKGPGIENMAPSLGPDGEGVEKFKKWTLDEIAVSFYFFISWRLWCRYFSAPRAATMSCCLATAPKAIELSTAFKTVPFLFSRYSSYELYYIPYPWKAEQRACACVFYSFCVCRWGMRKSLEFLLSLTVSWLCTKLGTFFFCLFREGFGGMSWITYCNKKDALFLWCYSLVKEKMPETLLGCCV